jgi:hypothetical protein
MHVCVIKLSHHSDTRRVGSHANNILDVKKLLQTVIQYNQFALISLSAAVFFKGLEVQFEISVNKGL